MTLRVVAVILTGGLLLTAAGADERKKSSDSPATDVKPVVAPPKPASPAPMTLPSTHYLEGQNPQHFPTEPSSTLQRELTYQEVAPASLSAKERQILKTYAVADLVVPLPPAGTADKPLTEKPKTLERELIRRITTSVAPKSWAGAGGEGTIEYFPVGLALIVNQTPDVQAAVEKMLDAMRQMQDQQVLTELRIVTVSDDWFAKSDLKTMVGAEGKRVAKKVVMLKKDEADKMLHAVQEDPAAAVLSAPRIITLNGQPGVLKTGQTEHYVTELKSTVVNGQVVSVPKNEPQFLGIEMKLEPNVSACGQYIRLTVEGSSRELGITPVPMLPVSTNIRPVSEEGKNREDIKFTQYIQDPKIITRAVAETIVLPDGGMALLYGGKATIEETVKEPVPPMVTDIPYIAALFSKERKTTKTNHLFVMLRSRVIKPEAGADESESCCKNCDGKLAQLLGEYSRACKTGKTEDARRLAMECLVIDPTCFAKK